MFELSQSITYFEALKQASSFLEKNKKSKFAAEWLMRERLEWSKTELINYYSKNMPTNIIKQFEKDINQFKKGQPMQHIVGHDWFYNRKFKVNEYTLIPRPETEEWLDQVLSLLPQHPLKVLDIGTGTGILAITDQLERRQDNVIATDISYEALKIAKKNAKRLGAKVEFKQGNLLEPVVGEKFDMILCNPPYIAFDEVHLMDKSVFEYEPKSALFAENHGLAVYEDLADSLPAYLKSNARVFLEIGYAQGAAVKKIFEKSLPEAEIEIWKDFNQLDRVIAIFNK